MMSDGNRWRLHRVVDLFIPPLRSEAVNLAVQKLCIIEYLAFTMEKRTHSKLGYLRRWDSSVHFIERLLEKCLLKDRCADGI